MGRGGRTIAQGGPDPAEGIPQPAAVLRPIGRPTAASMLNQDSETGNIIFLPESELNANTYPARVSSLCLM